MQSTVIVDLSDEFDQEYCDVIKNATFCDNASGVTDNTTGTLNILLEVDDHKDVSVHNTLGNVFPQQKRKRKGRYSDIFPQVSPFICPFEGCGKELIDKLQLRRHYRNHEERKHLCSYCPQKFLYLKDKRIHERTHTGERPYECQVCKKSFVQKCTLANHLITHKKDEKSEKCDLCGRAYSYKKSLAQHKKEKHDDCSYRYTCTFCNKKYIGRSSYELHLLKCKKLATTNVDLNNITCLTTNVHPKETHWVADMLQKQKVTEPNHLYQCGSCRNYHHTEAHLKRHMQSKHSIRFDDCIQVHLVHPLPEVGMKTEPVNNDEEIEVTPVDYMLQTEFS